MSWPAAALSAAQRIFGDPTYALDAGCALRMYAEGRVVHWAAGAIRNDAIWGHPAMQAVVQDLHEGRLRADLLTAVERLPELFSIAESLPATYVHGDAHPQNLLAQADEPDEFVVIDWGFNCPLAVGFDLGQLLVGLAHAGELDVNDWPRSTRRSSRRTSRAWRMRDGQGQER